MLNLRYIMKNNPLIGNNQELKEEVIKQINILLEDKILLSKDECIYIASLNNWNLIKTLFEKQNISTNLQEIIFVYYLHKKNYDFFYKIYNEYKVSLCCQEFNILEFACQNNSECEYLLDIFFKEDLFLKIPLKKIFHLAYTYDFKYKKYIIDYLLKDHKSSIESFFYDLFESPQEIKKAILFLENFPLFNLENIYIKLSSYPIYEGELENSYLYYLYQKFPIDLSFKHNFLLQNALIILNEELINFLVSFPEVIEKIDEQFIYTQRHSQHYQKSKIFLEEIVVRYKLENF